MSENEKKLGHNIDSKTRTTDVDIDKNITFDAIITETAVLRGTFNHLSLLQSFTFNFNHHF